MKLLSNIFAVVYIALFSSRALSSEEVKVAFPRSSYTIAYQNADTISIKCKKDHSCFITTRVNGHTYKLSPKDIDVTKINPLFASLRTPLANQSNRHYSFELTISTSCPSRIIDKDVMCLTSVSVLNGKVTSSTFEATAPYPGII